MLQPQHATGPQPTAGGAEGASGLQFSGQAICRICHRATGSMQAPGTGVELPSASKDLPHNAAFLHRVTDELDFLAANRVELKIIAHTATGVAAASTFLQDVERGDRDNLEVSF